MKSIRELVFAHINKLRGDISESSVLTQDEINRAVDELDDLQETLAYSNL